MFLGLDISTSCIGVTVLDKDGHLVLSDAIKLSKTTCKDLIDKIEFTRDFFVKLKQTHEIKVIYVEDFLKKFKQGHSSANIIAMLAGFNTTVCWLCYDVFKIKPTKISFTAARNFLGIDIKGIKDKKLVKKAVLDFIIDKVPGFPFEKTRFGNPTFDMYDRADSCVVAKFAYYETTKVPVKK